MSGRKSLHNEVIPASLFRYDKETKVFVGFFTELTAPRSQFNTLVTIHNEKTHGEVVFEVEQWYTGTVTDADALRVHPSSTPTLSWWCSTSRRVTCRKCTLLT
jgi:hypothetical protein